MSVNQHYADAASRILQHKGAAQADATRQNGAIWGQAIGQLGSIASQGVTQIAAEHKEAEISKIFEQYGSDYDGAVNAVTALDPVKGAALAKHRLDMKKDLFDLKTAEWGFQKTKLDWTDRQLANVTDQASLIKAIATVKEAGGDTSNINPTYNKADIDGYRQKQLTVREQFELSRPKPPEGVVINGDLVDKFSGTTMRAGTPRSEQPPAVGTEAHEIWLRMQQAGQPVPLSVDQVEGRAPEAAPVSETERGLAAYAAQRDAKAKAPSDTRSPAHKEYQDYQAEGGTLAFNDYMTMDANRKAVRVSVGGSGGGSGAGARDTKGLVEAVIANPGLFDQLTPSDKARIAPELNRQGFGDLGKPLPQAAVTKISETKSAVDSLRELKQVLKDNADYVGPIAGLQALNPYSDARKAQAKIDMVRQRVGKALEGGVLRKEDEEKYKKILATLRDTPSLAVSKIDGLIQTVETDIANYINEQRLSGRRVNTTVAGRPNAAPAAGKGTPDPLGIR